MSIIIFCVLLFVFGHVNANYTFTYDMALRCKEHICKHGYSYEKFYHIDSNDRHSKDSDVLFEMHIAILAASNGHILLSTVPSPEARDPVYEIVVGGGGNKFTELRRNLRKNAKSSVPTAGVLSAVEMRPFYIKIMDDGVIEFGKDGQILPLITYKDTNPLSIKYFSFAAWSGVEAKFLYDCPMPGDNHTEAPNSKAVEPKLSNSDRLIMTLLYYKDPNAPPAQQVAVDFGFRITSFSYDELTTIVTCGVSFVFKWTDNSIAWNPSKFNGTTHLTLRQGQIWSPLLTVIDDFSGAGPRGTEPITVLNSGEATLYTNFVIKVMCNGVLVDNIEWPNEKYECSLVFEPWEIHDKITLKLMNENSPEMKLLTGIQDEVVSTWELDIKQKVTKPFLWNYIFWIVDNVTHESDMFQVDIQLKRRSQTYVIVLYTPLTVLVSFILMSFWTEPLKMERVWIYTTCVVVICMGLCYIDSIVPYNAISSIQVKYTIVLSGILLALLAHVALMTLLAKKLSKTLTVHNVLTSEYFKAIFCLPGIKVEAIYESINEGYSVQEDDDAHINPTYGNVGIEEMEQESTGRTEIVQLAQAVDRTLFIVYSITFAALLTFH